MQPAQHATFGGVNVIILDEFLCHARGRQNITGLVSEKKPRSS